MATFTKMAQLVVTLLLLGLTFGVFAAPGTRVRRHFVAHPGSVPGYGGYSGGGGGGGGGGGSGFGGHGGHGGHGHGHVPVGGNIGIPAAGQSFSKSSASASSMSASGGYGG